MNNIKEIALTLPGYGKVQTPPGIPSGASSPSNIIQASLNLLVIAVVVGALIFILYGGILWATSGGDKAKIDKAKRSITFSIVGLVVMILAVLIVQTVGLLLGVSFLENYGEKGGGGTGRVIENPTQCRLGGGFCDGQFCTAGNPIGSCGLNDVCCSR